MSRWQQQTDKPLFPSLIWSKPETKRGAGKLLIIGGQAENFARVAEAYGQAEKAGAGIIRVIMPESTRKATQFLPNIEYAPSNTSGSFAKKALANFFDTSSWADHVLLAGDFGKNSETTTVLDGYLLRYPTKVAIADDALASIHIPYDQLIQKPVTLVLSSKSLQKLGRDVGLKEAIVTEIGTPKLAGLISEITAEGSGSLVCLHSEQLWVSARGNVSSTPVHSAPSLGTLSAQAAVWAMQNPGKYFEALTSAVYEISRNDRNQ